MTDDEVSDARWLIRIVAGGRPVKSAAMGVPRETSGYELPDESGRAVKYDVINSHLVISHDVRRAKRNGKPPLNEVCSWTLACKFRRLKQQLPSLHAGH